MTSQNSRARPRPVFLPRPRGRRPTSRAGPRPTTLRLERQVAGLRVGARRHGGSVSYRPKSNYSDRTCLKISFLTSEKGDLPWESPRLERCWIEASVVSLLLFLMNRRRSTIAYLQGRTTSSALAEHATIFCPPPALFIPEGPFIAVHPASAGARAGFPDFVWRDHVWRLRLGFANQKSTAPAALFRFFGERERPETAPKTRLFDRLAPLVASFRAQGGFGRGFVGVGRPNSVTSQNSRARPRPVFLPRPRGRRPTSRAGPRPTTLRLERQVAGLRVGARRHGGSVSYRLKKKQL